MTELLYWAALPAVYTASLTKLNFANVLIGEAAALAYAGYQYHPVFYIPAAACVYLYSGIGRENPLRFLKGNSFPGYKAWLDLVMGKQL
jgi:hypothetical protein